MTNLPKLKSRNERRNINIVVDREIDELYRLAKQNGYDSSEIARQAVSKEFRAIQEKIRKPA